MPIADTVVETEPFVIERRTQLVDQTAGLFTGNVSGTVVDHLAIGESHEIAAKDPVLHRQFDPLGGRFDGGPTTVAP